MPSPRPQVEGPEDAAKKYWTSNRACLTFVSFALYALQRARDARSVVICVRRKDMDTVWAVGNMQVQQHRRRCKLTKASWATHHGPAPFFQRSHTCEFKMGPRGLQVVKVPILLYRGLDRIVISL